MGLMLVVMVVSRSKSRQKSNKNLKRSEKFAKIVDLEEPTFLTFNISLAFTKIGFRYIKLMTISSLPLLKIFKNWRSYQLQSQSFCLYQLYLWKVKDSKNLSFCIFVMLFFFFEFKLFVSSFYMRNAHSFSIIIVLEI